MNKTSRLSPLPHRVAVATLVVAPVSIAHAEDFTPSQGEEPRQALELNLSEGQVFTQNIEERTEMGQHVMGQQMDMEQRMTKVIVHEVQSVDGEGQATVEMTYDRAALHIDGGPGMALEYDTAEDNAEPSPLAPLDGLIGQSITYTVDRQGNVDEVDGIDGLLESMVDAAGEMPAEQRGQVMGMLQEHFGEEAIREQFMHHRVYPEEPVGEGARWQIDAGLEQPVPIAVDHRFTLRERGEEHTVLDLESKLELGDDAEPIQSGPARIQLNLSGEAEGTLHLDAESGIVRELETTTELEGPIDVQMEQQDQQMPPIEGEMSFTTRTTINATDGRPD